MVRTASNQHGRSIKVILTFVAALLLTAWSLGAQADGVVVGPDCTITITPPTVGGPVEGYRLYYGDVPGARTLNVDVGNNTQPTCGANGIPEGQIYMVVRAYNVVGEAADSTEIPFVLVQTAPGPASLQVTPLAP